MSANNLNFSGYCGTSAPAFEAFVELANPDGTRFDTTLHSLAGKVALTPGGSTVATLTYEAIEIDGIPGVLISIADPSSIPPGIYQHQTTATLLADSSKSIILEGEVSFRRVL